MDGAFPSEKGQDFDELSAGGYGRGAGAGRRGFRGTAENSKTKICTRWQAGDCRFGDRCNFAHGEHELRKLPPREENGAGRFGPGRGAGRGPPAGYAYNNGRGSGPGAFRGPAPRPGGYDETYGQYPQAGYGGAQQGGYGAPAAAAGNYNAGAPAQQGGAAAGYGPVGGAQDQAQPRATGQGGDEAWAANGYALHGPNGWVMYKVKETGEPYYHNHRTNLTQWERPPEWPAS